MKTADLPLSENVEDRRGERPTNAPRKTLAEMLAQSDAEPFKAEPHSALAKQAGAGDI
jgi:hypothetical protein